jgi:hypothetical protein
MFTTFAIALMTRLVATPATSVDVDDIYQVRHLAGPRPTAQERMRLPLGRAYKDRARWAGVALATR